MFNFLMSCAAIVLATSIVLLVVTAKIASMVDRVHPTIAFMGKLAIFWIGGSITGIICLVSLEALDPVVASEGEGILANLAESAYIMLGYFGGAFVLVGGFVALGAVQDLCKTMRRKGGD